MIGAASTTSAMSEPAPRRPRGRPKRYKDQGKVPDDSWRHLKSWREYRNLSQEKVAEVLGTAQSTVQRWENGEIRLLIERQRQLAQLYGTTPTMLFQEPETAAITERLDLLRRLASSMTAEELDNLIFLAQRISGASKP